MQKFVPLRVASPGKFLEILGWSFGRVRIGKGSDLAGIMPQTAPSKAAILYQGNGLCNLESSCNFGDVPPPPGCWQP